MTVPPAETMEAQAPQASPESTSVGRRKLLYLVTEDWYFCSHRLPIARAARDAGYDVVVATRVQSHGGDIEREGFRLVPLRWRRRSLHPWREARVLIDLVRLYRREKPDLVHHIALKPTMYGSLAARLTRRPALVNTVAGLGYLFTSDEWKARTLSPIFGLTIRSLLRGANARLILQNPDDHAAAARIFQTRPEQMVLIKGSGVDIHRFVPTSPPEGPVTIAMVSRMLWDKGVGDLVDASRQLRERGMDIRVHLVGAPDPENPRSIPEDTLRSWSSEGLIEWQGHVEDVCRVWSQASMAVLPTSYGEGIPKTLLEAAACARPIIATDMPGCREIVRDGENGLLVPVKNADALAEAIATLAADPDMRRRMGEVGRELVVEQFSEGQVVEQTLAVYDALLKGKSEGGSLE
jgi:glycosyltransferase involved in cell wall biosynthesis